MALGAQREDVLKLVVGRGFTLALIGVGIGVGGDLGLPRFLSDLLYGVKPSDSLTVLTVLLVLSATALQYRKISFFRQAFWGGGAPLSAAAKLSKLRLFRGFG